MPSPGPADQSASSASATTDIQDSVEASLKGQPASSTDLSDASLEKIPGARKVYSRAVLATFSAGMVDPFLTSIAVDMNISGGQMGWLRAVSTLLGNFVQPIFGYLSDKVRKRSLFVALSNILYSCTWILLLFSNTILMVIIMAGILSLVVSLGTPAWTALLGEITPMKIRGKIIANVNWFSQFSSILSTILGGLLLNNLVGSLILGSWSIRINMFVPIIIGLLAGLGSAVVILSFKEKAATKRAQRMNALLLAQKQKDEQAPLQPLAKEKHPTKTVVEELFSDDVDHSPSGDELLTSIAVSKKEMPSATDSVVTAVESGSRFHKMRLLVHNTTYLKFTLIFAMQSFFMSMCWPLYPIRQRGDVGADYFEIAVLAVFMSLATLTTIRYAGMVSDRIGRRPQMFANRFVLAIMPLLYAFSDQLWHMLLINLLLTIFLGLSGATINAYLIDITPEADRSTYVGLFNMVYGVMLFLGSLFGGYLLDFLMGELTIAGFGYNFVQESAVSIAFIIGFIGRFFTALPFLTLKEAKDFPYKARELPRLVLQSKEKFASLTSSLVILIMGSFFFMSIMGYWL